jgi:LysM repeat protein
LSTSLKGLVWIVVAGVALSLAILAGLPGMAEAQEVETQTLGTASTEAKQNTTTDDEKGAPAAWRPAPESSTTRLVVEPGDSLWSISEEHIGPGATPKQIAYEVERTFDLNRGRIGEDPNLIFPGQEFVLLSPASDTAATAPVSQEPAAQQAPNPIVVQSEGVSDSPVAEPAVSEEAVPENGASGGAVSEDAVTAPPTSGQTDEQAENASTESVPAESVPAESVPTTTAAGGVAGSLLEVYDNIKVERRLLGIGILALTLIVAILMAMRLPMRRNVEDPAAWGIPQDYYENYARPEAPREASSETSTETARRPEGEPSSSPAPEAPPEEPTREPSTSTSGTTANIPTGETEGDLPVGAAPADASARSRERLRRARHLKRISQRRSPTSW